MLELLASRRWLRRSAPFDHVVAREVFAPGAYAELVAAFRVVLSRGLVTHRDPQRFSRSLPTTRAFAYHLSPSPDGALDFFYRRDWHDLLCEVLQIEGTRDVAVSLHHHQPQSPSGSVHRDLGLAHFTDQYRPDGINPTDLARCSYTLGPPRGARVRHRTVVRAATAIFYLGNQPWAEGDGGETGLYSSASDPVMRPAVAIPPRNNTLVLFESTPDSYHSYVRSERRVRNSVVLWLHRAVDQVERRWGRQVIYDWRTKAHP